VILVNGACVAWVARAGRALLVDLPDEEPARATIGRALADRLATLALESGRLLVSEVNGAPAREHPLAAYLVDRGFTASALGFSVSRHLAARV
jgi:hypothetical protein